MKLLCQEPGAPVESEADLIGIALALEREAVRRYRQLASLMDARGAVELREPYVRPYFEEIDRVWRELPIEMSARIVRGLYPGDQDLAEGSVPEDHPVLVLTDSWLDEHTGSPQSLRRIVVEERDHLLRALKGAGAPASR